MLFIKVLTLTYPYLDNALLLVCYWDKPAQMKYSWSKTVLPIAALFSFRMLGLFLLIPVFSIYAMDLQGATPQLIGFALGVYGLTQGLFQIPFGMLSDRVGRKPVITLGLLLFALGSFIGIFTVSINGMIVARTLQGMGAIGSVLIALLADLTPDNQRTKAMAVIGATIGMSFTSAMVMGPALAHRYGLGGIFCLTMVLALLGILLLHVVIPTPAKERLQEERGTNVSLIKSVLFNPRLLKLDIGIFCQHFILTATFFAVPLILKQHMTLGHLTAQWHFYLPLMIGSFIVMIPFIFLAERKQCMKAVFLIAVFMMTLSQGVLAFSHEHWFMLCFILFVYFIGFNILEATLPSLVSREASASIRGTAMGIYSTGQFLGIFAGGALAGIVYQGFGLEGIFITNMLVGSFWLIASAKLFSNR